jgi:hypothetical protein
MNIRTLTTISMALLCAFYSCSTPPNNTAAKRRVDSLALQAKALAMAKQMMQHQKDSLAHADSLALRHAAARAAIHKNYGPCPVSVKSCAVVSDHHGKSVIVTLKNISSRKIDAVRIAWTVYNKSGKAIGGSKGSAKKALARGKTSSYAWGINAPSGTRAKASVAGIRYTDGSVWAVSED